MGKTLVLLDEFLERVSRWGLVICLLSILGLTISSIILRWMGSSLLWIEPLVRHIVFFSAFLGGSLATSKGVHIKIDLMTHMIEKTRSGVLLWLHRNLVALFSLVVCLGLTKAGWDFFLVEKEFETVAFLNISSSYLVGIIPVGMGLISLRFFNQILISFLEGRGREHHRV